MANSLDELFKVDEEAKLDFNDDYLSSFGVSKYIYCVKNHIRIYNKSCIFYINKDCLKCDCKFSKIGLLLYNFYSHFNKYSSFLEFLNKYNMRIIRNESGSYDIFVITKNSKSDKIKVETFIYKNSLNIKFNRLNKLKLISEIGGNVNEKGNVGSRRRSSDKSGKRQNRRNI